MSEDLASQASVLLTAVGTLDTRIDTLTASNEKLARRGHWDRILVIAAIVGLALDLALSTLFIIQRVDQVHTNHQIACQNHLRSKTAAIADRDRRNVDMFFTDVASVKTAQQFTAAYQRYLNVRNADDAARAALGNGKASTCG